MLYTIGITMIIIGIIFKVFPPKKINYIYGHRTRFAMKNQDTWDEAQRYSANSLIILGIICTAIGIILNYLFKGVREEYQGSVFFIGIITMILIDEMHLRKIFNKDGARKQ